MNLKYKSDKALNRLQYTISKGNKANNNDITAYNDVIEYLNKLEGQSIKSNELFAKMYVYYITQTIRYYKGNVFNLDIVNLDLHSKLKIDLDKYFFAFREDLIHNQFGRLIDKWKNEGMSQDKILKEKQEFEKKYSQEYVDSKLNEMINGALVSFS